MKNAITKTFLMVLLAVSGMAKGQQWTELHTGVTEDLYDVCCIDSNTVFVCGQNGVILKSIDGGNSWQEKYRQSSCTWYNVKFFDFNIGFVLGDDDNSHDNVYKLFKTIDGGETWMDMGSPFTTHNYISSSCELFIVDPDTLYVASDQLMKSTDGGISFFQLEVEGLTDVQDLYFEGNTGYIVFGLPNSFIGTHVAKTTDYGSSWEEILSFPYYSADGILKTLFLDKDHVTIYGAFGFDENELNYEYDEIRTEDGFETYQWRQNESLPWDELWPPISGVCFSDSQNGIIVYQCEVYHNSNSIISYQTHDGGDTWLELNTLIGPIAQSAVASGCEGVYYLAGGDGSAYKLNTIFDGVVEEKEIVFAFPNPTSNTILVFGKANSIITVYDLLGRVLFQKKMLNEIQEIEIGGFSSKVFLVCIKKDNKSTFCQKIIKK